MTAPDDGAASGAARPWPRVGVLRRIGPAIVVVLALVLAGTVATIHRGTASSAQAAGSRSSSGGVTGVPVTYQIAHAAGRAGDFNWGPGCDTSTGRLKMPIPQALPCVPVATGPNGGSTWQGVSGSTITVAFYEPEPGDLLSSLPGATDPPPDMLADIQDFVAMLNRIATTYGRHVVLVPFQGTGLSDDPVAGRADAIDVAEDLHAFASIGGPLQTAAYQDELAQRHVLCVGCGLSVPYSDYVQDAPNLWGVLPTPDALLTDVFNFVASQLVGKDAVYAGEAQFRTRKRVFAVVHYDQNPPVFGPLTATLTKEFAPKGVRVVDNESYLLDIPELPTEAATIAEHLAASGATTVVFAGDPIMPIYLTKAAAAIGYFPEWVISGTVFTDTTTLGRLFNQQEWSHAFGISSLPVPLPAPIDAARTLYRWYFGGDPPGLKTANVLLPEVLLLFEGIQLAGPHLTPASFEQGMFNYPVTGGGPTNPLLGYGDKGAPPLPAYTNPADYTLIWWDATGTGLDEEGVYGTGVMRYVQGGKRYKSGTPPIGALPPFDLSGTVTSYAVPPPGDRAPMYPPWPGSPVALAAH